MERTLCASSVNHRALNRCSTTQADKLRNRATNLSRRFFWKISSE